MTAGGYRHRGNGLRTGVVGARLGRSSRRNDVMQMQSLTEQHMKLARLVGTWRSEEQMFPSPWDPKGGSAVGHTEMRSVLDGYFVESNYSQERDGTVSYRG